MSAIELQVVAGALHAACEEMGAVLIRGAHSANIKERRDCSTALFDADGEMVMQAEHIPVHLGAMPAAVAAVAGRGPPAGRLLGPQRPLPRRHPPARHHGGDPDLRRRRRCSASRPRAPTTPTSAGRIPGSMPADSRTLDEEGVVIAPRMLDDAAIDELAAQMRQPDERRADLRAQLAANRVGVRRTARAGRAASARTACAPATPRCSTTPSGAPRACIAAMPDGTPRGDRRARGRRRRPRAARARHRRRRRARRSTSPAAPTRHDGNLNCPLAVTRSRLLLRRARADRPRHPGLAGAYRPDRRCVAPEGSLLNARAPAAVVGGNVETSSRVADLVLRAFGRALRAGHDEQPHARQRPTSPTTRRSAAARAPAPTPTARAASTWRCRNTLNTPVEALELGSRCASRSTRSAAAAAATAPTVAATGWSARSRRWRTMHLLADHRAPPPRPAGRRGRQPGATGRNTLDGASCRPKAPGHAARRPAAAHRDAGRRRARGPSQ